MINHSPVQHNDLVQHHVQQGTVLQFPKSERTSHACAGFDDDGNTQFARQPNTQPSIRPCAQSSTQPNTQPHPDSSLKQQATPSSAQPSMPECDAYPAFISEPQRMFKPEQGYTRLPNLLIDEQIMAQLNDKAFKCLMLIVRQTVGFDRAWQRISIGQFQQACGIKKRDTVMRCVADLEACQIIEVKRKTGCLNDFCFTPQHFKSALLTAPVVQAQQAKSKQVESKSVHLQPVHLQQTQTQSACQVAPVPNQAMAEQENLTRPVQEDGTCPIEWEGSRPTQRDTIKQSSKENLKDREVSLKRKELSPEPKERSPERAAFTSQSNVMLGFVKYFPQDTQRYSLEQLCQHYQTQQDFLAQAQTSYPQMPHAQLQDMWQQMAQWSLTRMVGKQPQQWMNTWLNWIKNNAHKYHPAASLQTPVQSNTDQQLTGKTGQDQFKQRQPRENQFRQSQQKRSNKAQEFDDFFAKHSPRQVFAECAVIADVSVQDGLEQDFREQGFLTQKLSTQNAFTPKALSQNNSTQHALRQKVLTQHFITHSDTATSVFEGCAVTEILEDGS